MDEKEEEEEEDDDDDDEGEGEEEEEEGAGNEADGEAESMPTADGEYVDGIGDVNVLADDVAAIEAGIGVGTAFTIVDKTRCTGFITLANRDIINPGPSIA